MLNHGSPRNTCYPYLWVPSSTFIDLAYPIRATENRRWSTRNCRESLMLAQTQIYDSIVITG
jgi:hypothetical protein